MRKLKRRVLLWLADAMEDDWAPALRKAARRRRSQRVRPLAFPTDFELMMERITDASIRSMGKHVVSNILHDGDVLRMMRYQEVANG